jgi:alkanesulfonate monooxygenase SsuD/methylene tetrahydromethanopterin reductase-like flavin-dependent oxidoreductase (luciferase family)
VSRGRIAVSVMPLDNRRETLIDVAVAADRLGYDAFSQTESWALDASVLLAEAAVRTRRIGLATGVLGVWNRTPATLAMMAATLHGLSGGRFALGLGSSTAQLTEGLHDVAYTKPLQQIRRAVTQVRALLRGERVPLQTAAQARPLKLNVPPAPEVPIHLAALADESVRLTGELADGWLPFFYPRSRLDDGRERLAEGAARGGHPGRIPAIHPAVPTVVADRSDAAREGAAWFLSFYLTTMGPLYRQSLGRQGFATEVDAVLQANTAGAKGTVPASADRLMDEVIVWGTPAEARERLGRWHAAGAAGVCLLVRPNLAPDELRFTLEAFGPMLGPGGPTSVTA